MNKFIFVFVLFFVSANCNDIFTIYDQFLNVIKEQCENNILKGTINTTMTNNQMKYIFKKYSELMNSDFNPKDLRKDMAKSFKNKDNMVFIRNCEKVYLAFYRMDELVENLDSCLTDYEYNELRKVMSIANEIKKCVCLKGIYRFEDFFTEGINCINRYLKEISKCSKSNKQKVVTTQEYQIVNQICNMTETIEKCVKPLVKKCNDKSIYNYLDGLLNAIASKEHCRINHYETSSDTNDDYEMSSYANELDWFGTTEGNDYDVYSTTEEFDSYDRHSTTDRYNYDRYRTTDRYNYDRYRTTDSYNSYYDSYRTTDRYGYGRDYDHFRTSTTNYNSRFDGPTDSYERHNSTLVTKNYYKIAAISVSIGLVLFMSLCCCCFCKRKRNNSKVQTC